MRDPKRIRPFLDKLAAKWEEYPDLRFGQLVSNIAGCCPSGDMYPLTAMWSHEEDVWEAAINDFAVVPGKYRGEV